MKFGATLSRRSVPQWRTHDLDYDEIKLLIKEQTSSPDGCSREFERNLLAVLDTELERIDEFVRCKAGEIERRLDACKRTVKSILRERSTSGDATTDSEASPLKKVVKFEGEIDRYRPSCPPL
jgi:SPX domain protein involved in polyphosphate accumulation